jgi:hypothetical protein
MKPMNRSERRMLDRDVRKSINAIQAHLEFLNSAGNPKYKLVVQSDFSWKAKKLIKRLKFWGRQ